MAYLHRAPYRTDHLPPGTPGDPDGVVGMFSSEIPERMVDTIVGVDWSTPGTVWVTYLVHGHSPVS